MEALFLLILLTILLIPITLLTGAVLGSWRGGLAILVCLAEGATVLKFFVPGGQVVTFSLFLGPLGGYILPWPLAAYLTGLLSGRNLDRRFRASFLKMLPGSALIFVLTILLSAITTQPYIETLILLLLLAVVLTLVTSSLAAIVLTLLWKMPRLKQQSSV